MSVGRQPKVTKINVLPKVVEPIPVVTDTRYDSLLEQTQALLQQARNFNMRPDEIVMKFDAIVSGLTTDE